MTAAVPDPHEDIDWSKHQGSCRVFYAERRCTCGAVPGPRFRDQLAEDLATWLRARYPVTPAEARAEAHDLITEVIHPAANQRAAEELRRLAETAPVMWFDNAYPAQAVPVATLLDRAAALASPAPPGEEGL